MPLTHTAVKQAKAKARDYKLYDKEGLYLLVRTTGSKYWRYKYRFTGKEKVLALGVYPTVSLKAARAKLSQARKTLDAGQDPGKVRKEEKRAQKIRAAIVFETIAREWWGKQNEAWSENHAQRILSSLEADIFPEIGDMPVAEITAQDLLAALRKVENRDALDVAGRLLQRCSSVFRYAIQTGRATYNPALDLKGALKARKSKHQHSLSRGDLPVFLRRLDAYDGLDQTRVALRLLVLTFVRPGELRAARWDEFDIKAKEWRIPAGRMKVRSEHIVPLSRQAVTSLKELQPLTGQYELVFPSERSRHKPMSENTLLFALYRLGYKDRATPHGFRATASSILNEQGFNRDAVERQLAHQERNKVRAAYTHHAEYLEERRRMMQWWANHLDALKADDKKVVPMEAGKRKTL